jgi:prophage regulatory protein
MAQTNFPNNGLLRLSTVLELVPVSKSAWFEGIRSGIYPKPVKLGKRMSAWRASDIARLIEEGVGQ